MTTQQMESYIDNYVGDWDDERGGRLCIAKLDDQTASVSFLANHQAIARPWFENKLSTDMIGTYDPWEGLAVELWEKGKGFTLHLNFESQHELDEHNRDALSVALSRFEQDSFLDQYYSLFGPLRHYVRTAA